MIIYVIYVLCPYFSVFPVLAPAPFPPIFFS